jgi:hypothetical protein
MPYRFTLGNTELVFYDLKDGMVADTYIQAESIDEAENKSKLTVETIMSLIDYATSSASSPGIITTIYDATEGVDKREFRKVIHLPMPERGLKKIDPEVFRSVLEKFFVEGFPPEISRALALLRKGYIEKDAVNRFIFLWSGLEALNSLLADKFAIPLEDRYLKCDHCGKKTGSFKSVGIEKLFTNQLSYTKKVFHDIRRARGKFLHGHSASQDFINEIKTYNPSLRKALIHGIGLLMDLKNSTIQEIVEKEISRYGEEYRFVIKTHLTDFQPPEIVNVNAQPDILMDRHELTDRVLTDDGKITASVTSNFILQPRDVFKDDIVLEVRSDPGSLIENVKFRDV